MINNCPRSGCRDADPACAPRTLEVKGYGTNKALEEFDLRAAIWDPRTELNGLNCREKAPARISRGRGSVSSRRISRINLFQYPTALMCSSRCKRTLFAS